MKGFIVFFFAMFALVHSYVLNEGPGPEISCKTVHCGIRESCEIVADKNGRYHAQCIFHDHLPVVSCFGVKCPKGQHCEIVGEADNHFAAKCIPFPDYTSHKH